MRTIKELYKELQPNGRLFPINTDLDFWDGIYPDNSEVIDREFARRFSSFRYFDFMEAETLSESISNFKADVLSVLSTNQKRYAEMYRVFLVTDEEDPITYNYDMTETTGAQKQTNVYGGTSFTKGQETFTKGSETFTKGLETITTGSQTLTKGEEQDTKGQQINTEGAVTNTHSVAPYDSITLMNESADDKTSQEITEGQRIDTFGQRVDTNGQRIDTNAEREDTYSQRQDTESARTDTTTSHTDTISNDAWTLTRKGNIGVQTAGDILRIHTEYWTETYKFIQLIFDDICKSLLLIGDR